MTNQYVIKNDKKGYLATDYNGYSTFYVDEINGQVFVFDTEKEAEELVMEKGDYVFEINPEEHDFSEVFEDESK